ncbi:MAG: TIGR03905 family TSCPD domain-containing protein [Oscillospiraceae bacterium]|nr:TIGR03905 family TSCPD domain-containing protein [Oscillospiraceae bacterium]
MKTYRYTPRFVCSQEISFDLEDGKLHHVRFKGGCDGNLKAIGKLVEGKDAASVAGLLKGNDCGGRGTSCADQFARAIEEALKEESCGNPA